MEITDFEGLKEGVKCWADPYVFTLDMNLDEENPPSIWFGRLVKFHGTVIDTDDYDNVYFETENGSVTVKNYIGYEFQVGKGYEVTGVILWNYDRYKVVPRNADDIVEIE